MWMVNGIDSNKKEVIEYENALKLRMFEIDLFWKRSWFFGALLLALIGAFYKVKVAETPFIPPVSVAFILMITTLLQCLMNRGSKYWQERWEYITMNREGALGIELTKLKKFKAHEDGEWHFINASILAKGENKLTRSRRFSVSKLTFLVWDIIFICTFLNWLDESISIYSGKPDWAFTIKLCLFYFSILIYIFFFFKKGKVYEGIKAKDFKNYTQENLEQIGEDYANNTIE